MPYLRRRRLRSTSRSTSRSSRLYRRYRRYYRYRRRPSPWLSANYRDYSCSNVKVCSNSTISFSLTGGQYNTSVLTVAAFADSNNTALTSPVVNGSSALSSGLYRTYTELYEEVRLRAVRFDVVICDPVGGSSSIPAVLCMSAIDRRWGNGDSPPSVADLNNFATNTPVVFITNNVCKFSRSVSARDLIERTQYHDCSLGRQSIQGGGTLYYDAAWNQAGPNPNFFSPALHFALGFPVAIGDPRTLYATVRVTYYFTFRNPAPYPSSYDGTKPEPLPDSAASASATSRKTLEPAEVDGE